MTKVKQTRSGSGRAAGRSRAKSATSVAKGPRSRNQSKGATRESRRDDQPQSRRKRDRPTPAAKRVAPVRTVKVRALDPKARCGPGTTVEHLFRVDETVNGNPATHLVFYDRHGLYCEHGRTCPAVEDVRRANRNLDRTRKVG